MVIVSNDNSPSWIYLLDMFLEISEILKRITVIAPLINNHNLFVTYHIKIVQRKRNDFKDPFTVHNYNWVCNLQKPSDMYLYYGSFDSLVLLSGAD